MGKLFDLKRISEYAGNSTQILYIKDYVEKIGGTCFYVEEGYIDHEYMIDYQRFYSRHFDQIVNHTRRIHFFEEGVTFEQLTSADTDDLEIENHYLGFVVVKPIIDGKGNYCIGRTVLKPYEKRTLYVTGTSRVSVLGRELKIYSTPFTAQDLAVGACATVALWTTMGVLSPQLNIKMKSLYEITEEANECLTISSHDATNMSRQFPSDGLDSNQICHFLKSQGLEIELIQYDGSTEHLSDDELLEMFITGFLHARIPVIACLNFYSEMESGMKLTGLHAVTILGYDSDDEGKVNRLYVHDDRVGPYVSIKSTDSFKTWEYSHNDFWKNENVDEIRLDHVIVPLYHKIRLRLSEVLTEKLVHERIWGCKVKTRLYRVSEFKNEMLKRNLEKKEILEKPFSRYVWTGWSEKGDKVFLLDTTSPTVSSICEIDLDTGSFENRDVGYTLSDEIKKIT